MNRRLAALALAAVVALGILVALVNGCGAAPLSLSEFRSDVSALCRAAARRTTLIPAPRSPAQGAQFLQRGIAVLAPELTELRRLKAPTALAPSYPAALTAFERKLNALRGTERSLATGADPVAAMSALQQRLAPIEALEDSLWRSIGVPACVNR